VSSETPAAHVARLKVQYGARYAITADGDAYSARDRRSARTVRTASPADLEAELIEYAASDLPVTPTARRPG
jgi:hypothetical protein